MEYGRGADVQTPLEVSRSFLEVPKGDGSLYRISLIGLERPSPDGSHGQLDYMVSTKLKEYFAAVFSRPAAETDEVVLDLSKIEHTDSAGFSALLLFYRGHQSAYKRPPHFIAEESSQIDGMLGIIGIDTLGSVTELTSALEDM